MHRDSVMARSKEDMKERGHDAVASANLDREDIWKAFNMFDTSKDGFIPSTYILPALKTLGWALTETDAVQIILDMDTNMSGYVEYAQFAEWIIRQESENNDTTDPIEVIRGAFQHIDKDGSGSITATELLEALRELGEDLDYEDVQKIVSEADENDDGNIDIHEFGMLMKNVMDAHE
jgi:Ca2+-binding EF-hand superfamily protein